MSVEVDSTVGVTIGAASAGFWWKRVEKSAAATVTAMQVVLSRGVNVWKSEGLGF